MNIISTLNGFESGKAKAAAIFPFVILRFPNHEMNETWIRHETIHHYQQIESMGISVLFRLLERVYTKYILHQDTMQSYLYSATEQEAYLNQTDEYYLAGRKPFAILYYVFHKTPFHLEEYQVILD